MLTGRFIGFGDKQETLNDSGDKKCLTALFLRSRKECIVFAVGEDKRIVCRSWS